MKKTGTVYKGAAKPKADVTIILSDDVFTQLAEGKVRHTHTYIHTRTHCSFFAAEWPKSIHVRKAEDKRQRDARDQARWAPQRTCIAVSTGTSSYTALSGYKERRQGQGQALETYLVLGTQSLWCLFYCLYTLLISSSTVRPCILCTGASNVLRGAL